MTLRQRREIVLRFKAGERLGIIRFSMGLVGEHSVDDIEQVIRDFMLGRFELKPKKRGKK